MHFWRNLFFLLYKGASRIEIDSKDVPHRVSNISVIFGFVTKSRDKVLGLCLFNVISRVLAPLGILMIWSLLSWSWDGVVRALLLSIAVYFAFFAGDIWKNSDREIYKFIENMLNSNWPLY